MTSTLDYNILFDAAPLGIFTYSASGRVIGANKFLLDMLGSPSLEATKTINVFDFENLRRSGVTDILKQALKTGNPSRTRCSYVSKWGKNLHLDVLALAMQSSEFGPLGLCILNDITELKIFEESLARSEKRSRILVESVPLGIAIMGEDNRLEYMNPAFETLFACSTNASLDLHDWLNEIMPDPTTRNTLTRIIMGDIRESLHFSVFGKSGAAKHVHFRSFRVEHKRAIVCEDNTELVTALLGESKSEKRYMKLLENLTDFIYTLDLEGTILSINEAAAKSAGFRAQELIGQSIDRLMPMDVRRYFRNALEDAKRMGVTQGAAQYVAEDGSTRYLEYRSTLVRQDDRPAYIVGIARDITERVRTKKALRESETKFKLIVECAHDGITHVDDKGVIFFCNQRMKEILKDPHPEGKLLYDYYDKKNKKILEENMGFRSEGRSTTYSITLTDKAGVEHKIVVSGAPFFDEGGHYKGAIGVFTDISHIKHLEEQLQQSQKMEALGALAGGIAHDFNNVLSGILGYASLLKKEAAPGSQWEHFVNMIEVSTERGAMLAGQLLAFSRKGEHFMRPLDVHTLMQEVAELLERTVERNISVYSHLKSPLSIIAGDPGQIQQMLMNLCINAKDAMHSGGKLVLSTDMIDINDTACSAEELRSGPYIRIRVEDTGEGMSEATKQRLFEPFFTTKEEGKGTGLGLSMVYATVKNHGGAVEVASDVDKGSLFTILLPLAPEARICENIEQNVSLALPPGTALIVDDEKIIRYLLSEMLCELGYEVFSAADGREAVQIYEEHWSEIDVVLLDMNMPRMNGREALMGMKRINPDVRIVISSGYVKYDSLEAMRKDGVVGFIQKPYRLEDLAKALALAIDPRTCASGYV